MMIEKIYLWSRLSFDFDFDFEKFGDRSRLFFYGIRLILITYADACLSDCKSFSSSVEGWIHLD